MAEARPGFPALIVLSALLACATPSPERLLDETCQARRCTTTGSARQTTGLTADSIGFTLGPGPGSVTIAIDHNQFAAQNLELLVKGSGDLVVTVGEPGCTGCESRSIELTEQWRWTPVGKAPSLTAGFEIVVETLDDSSTAALLDVRAL